MTQVSRSITIVWNTPLAVSKSLSVSWDLRNQVGISTAFRFQVYKYVDNTVDFKYATRNPISKSLSSSFNIGEGIYKTLRFSFKIDNPIKIKTKSLECKYDIKKSVHSRLIVPWEVIPLTLAPGTRYNRRYVVPKQEREYTFKG